MAALLNSLFGLMLLLMTLKPQIIKRFAYFPHHFLNNWVNKNGGVGMCFFFISMKILLKNHFILPKNPGMAPSGITKRLTNKSAIAKDSRK